MNSLSEIDFTTLFIFILIVILILELVLISQDSIHSDLVPELEEGLIVIVVLELVL